MGVKRSLKIEEIKEAAKQGAQEGIRAELGDANISRKTHIEHHLFIQGLMKWCNSIKSTFWKTIVKGVVATLVALVLIGFAVSRVGSKIGDGIFSIFR